MQSLGMIVTAGLGVLVIAEGAYIVRTRAQVADLAAKVEALSTAAMERSYLPPPPVGHEDREDDRLEPARAAPRPQLPLPRFTTETAPAAESGDPLPLPPAIGTPEAREQLRQFVVAQLERERQEARARDEQRMSQRTRERRLAAIAPLGLSPAEGERFMAITDKLDAARSSLRARVEAGQLDRAGIRQEMVSAREATDRELQALLGDERMKKYDQIRREQGPEGGPFGFGFGGGRRGPPPAPGAGESAGRTP